MNSMSLKDRVAIITGSGNGIGRAIADGMAGAGAKIVVSDVLVADGERVTKEIRDTGGEALFVAADVSQEEDVSS
jgi:NAD(P)-dependent dehydrogenase (short-subunit alcohol dehydrogenase family)